MALVYIKERNKDEAPIWYFIGSTFWVLVANPLHPIFLVFEWIFYGFILRALVKKQSATTPGNVSSIPTRLQKVTIPNLPKPKSTIRPFPQYYHYKKPTSLDQLSPIDVEEQKEEAPQYRDEYSQVFKD